MKTGADLQQRTHAAPDLGVAFGRRRHPGKDLQQGTFA